MLIFSCSTPLPEQIEFSACDAPYGYDCDDIAILQAFIDANSQVSMDYMDIDTNGIIAPTEFGYQVWDGGRLIQLNLNYNENAIIASDSSSETETSDYRLTAIPDSIGNLDYLETLFLHDNRFNYIPASIYRQHCANV